jgi:hypothetical protein
MTHLHSALVSLLCLGLITASANGQAEPEVQIQGEYVGKMRESDFALQVVAQGKDSYLAVVCPGGLPGAGWTMDPPTRPRVEGKMADGELRFTGNGWVGVLKAGEIGLQDAKGTNIGTLKRIERKSETLGSKPPEGARVLFDGSSLDAFAPGARKTDDGLLMEGCATKESFGDCRLHVEFLLPFMPEARGQGRGNSGVYLSSRYEVQVLDSFGLTGEHNECGGIYQVAKPKVNMCLPPGQWQTYDIEFVAPRFDEQGKKLTDALVTVQHNGVLIQDKTKVPHATTAAPINNDGPSGPIHFQNHGNPVRYRNLWIVPVK